MDVKRMTAESLIRQLGLCDKNAEIMVTIGNIPIAIPANSMSIKENADKKEIISINVTYNTLSEIVKLGNKMLDGKKRAVKSKKYFKKIKVKKGK